MAELSSEDVALLAQKLNIPEESIMKQHAAYLGWLLRFTLLCSLMIYREDKYPSGEMTKEEFVSYTLEKDDTADEDIANSLFEIFDKDASGAMDFSEFIMACQASKVGNSEN